MSPFQVAAKKLALRGTCFESFRRLKDGSICVVANYHRGPGAETIENELCVAMVERNHAGYQPIMVFAGSREGGEEINSFGSIENPLWVMWWNPVEDEPEDTERR